MKGNPDAPAVGRGPDQQPAKDDEHRQTQYTMRSHDAEIDQGDDRGNRQPIADDGESPRITGIAFEHETADRAAFEVCPT